MITARSRLQQRADLQGLLPAEGKGPDRSDRLSIRPSQRFDRGKRGSHLCGHREGRRICKQSQSNEAEKIRFLGNQYQSIKSWAAEFDRATPEQQKMILAKLIEKITVDRNYNIHIYFFVTQYEFRQSVSSERTTVSEAERCEFAV